MTSIRTTTSIEFRDAVMKIQADGEESFAYREGADGPVYHVLSTEPRHSMTMLELFERDSRPVYMEDMARAMITARHNGQPSVIWVFSR